MGRRRGSSLGRYDYPKEGQSLTEISQRVLGKEYCMTTDSEARRMKKIFREIHKR